MQTLFQHIQIESHNTLNHKTYSLAEQLISYLIKKSIWLILGLEKVFKQSGANVSREHETILNWLHKRPIKILFCNILYLTSKMQ